jgi:hypothetical protein
MPPLLLLLLLLLLCEHNLDSAPCMSSKALIT